MTALSLFPPADDLPHSYEAEQGLLGAILTNNRAIERVPPEFRAEHFADPLHARIYETLRHTIDRGELANPVTLRRMFEGDDAAPGLPVGQYMVKLAGSVVAIVNAEDYARTITDLWARRATVLACREIIAGATDPESSGEAVLEAAESRIRDIGSGARIGRRDLTPFGDGIHDTLGQIEAAWKAGGVSGLSTGLKDLDERTAGLHPGSLVIVGARPGMGKSDFALNLAYSAAAAGKSVGFFSLEMSKGLLTNRLLARATGIPATNQISGRVSEAEIAALSAAAGRLKGIPLWIDDSAASTVEAIGARARRLQRRHGLDLVMVDYLQLIAPGNSRRRRETNRTEDVTMISQALKGLAKDLGVPVVALSQLSRAVEGREDKRPTLADLRESGAIEQDADVVIFLYRESYYLDRDDPKQRQSETAEHFADRRTEHERRALSAMNTAEAIIAKQRMGSAGTVNLYYKPAHSHFADLHWRDER